MIETERLILRRHRLDDLDARVAIHADPDHLRFIGGPQGREECWARIQRYAGHWALKGHGMFALEERASGRLIGEAGLASFERGLGEDFDRAPEAAWMIAAEASGQGLAEEAVRAAIGWHAQTYGPMRTVAVIGQENGASLRLAERLGFQRFAERPYRGTACLLLERQPPPPAGPEKRFGREDETR